MKKEKISFGNDIVKMKSFIRKTLQILIIGIIFYYIAKNLYQNWHEVSTYEWNINWFLAFFAFLILMCGGLLFVFGWSLIVRKLSGSFLDFKKSLKINFLSNLGRYIPGKFWTAAGNVYLCSKEGIPIRVSSTSFFVMTIIQIVSALLIFLLSLIFWKEMNFAAQVISPILFAIIIIPIGLVFLYPSIINGFLNYIIRKLKRDRIKINLKYSSMLLLTLYWCGLWILNGLAYYFLITSIYPLTLYHIPVVSGILAFAWVAGFLAFFAPAGLGIFEISIIFLLGFYMSDTMATVIALLARILRTINDIVLALITWKL